MYKDLDKSFHKDPDTMGMYISVIYRHMQILISDALKPYGIGNGQLSFFLAIATEEGISQKKLSEELLIDKTTTAKAITKLEKEGYVRREVDPDDKRSQRLFLTEEGKEVLPKVEEILGTITRQSTTGINSEDFETMMRTLNEVLNNVMEQVNDVRENRSDDDFK